MEKKNDNTLLKNASFLMVAALVSKIIGLIYKSPLSALSLIHISEPTRP